ncbi:MAG: deoxyguanosinetriphosphate triphosphohydrolase [Clostridia bacterium]|nr:deoxyguanosinetriphosphate triphosphohydrolase [Clostridia bacterium]MDY5264616.1 deoxyguanosinetriphosphate triphosphohydrolase [Eubacteriales bacterium]MDY5439460.1 deoxyguanosinetriphosphate triphosphohydrolase [Eubacteriales bacterium]
MKDAIYQMEQQFFSKYAVKSSETKGRAIYVEPCPLRTEFQRDRDRIIHSKAFRRLKHKTQVFLSPEGDHYRTRLTHTLEVSQIARTVARALRLNEDLVEAISLGHDLGHTPFGHEGEKVLSKILGRPFEHNEQSLRVVDKLENDGAGLNLTYEVRDGILQHKISGKPATLEGKIVSYADRIAYVNHDIDDGIRAGILKEEDLPRDVVNVLGNKKGDRINSLVQNLVKTSYDKPYVKLDDEYENALKTLRTFMFTTLYQDKEAKQEEKKADRLIEFLFEYFMSGVGKMPIFYEKIANEEGREIAVCDYVAGMSDRYAIKLFNELIVPKSWQVL